MLPVSPRLSPLLAVVGAAGAAGACSAPGSGSASSAAGLRICTECSSTVEGIAAPSSGALSVVAPADCEQPGLCACMTTSREQRGGLEQPSCGLRGFRLTGGVRGQRKLFFNGIWVVRRPYDAFHIENQRAQRTANKWEMAGRSGMRTRGIAHWQMATCLRQNPIKTARYRHVEKDTCFSVRGAAGAGATLAERCPELRLRDWSTSSVWDGPSSGGSASAGGAVLCTLLTPNNPTSLHYLRQRKQCLPKRVAGR